MAVSTSQSPFKFVLFGSHSPGKSSLRSRFTDGKCTSLIAESGQSERRSCSSWERRGFEVHFVLTEACLLFLVVNQEPATPYFWVKRMTLNDVEHTIEVR